MEYCPKDNVKAFLGAMDSAQGDISEDDKLQLFTFNPNLKKFKGLDDKQIFCTCLRHIFRYVPTCWSNYAIVAEWSDVGKLHYHGWFIMSDKIKWTKSVNKKFTTYGFLKINLAKCKDKVLKYYRKDAKDSAEITSEWEIPWYMTHDTLHHLLRRIDALQKQEIIFNHQGKIPKVTEYGRVLPCVVKKSYDEFQDIVIHDREIYWLNLVKDLLEDPDTEIIE